MQDEYKNEIKSLIDNVKKKFNPESIKDLIFNIDKNLPEDLNEYKLPDNRKELMVKLITLRVKKLVELQ